MHLFNVFEEREREFSELKMELILEKKSEFDRLLGKDDKNITERDGLNGRGGRNGGLFNKKEIIGIGKLSREALLRKTSHKTDDLIPNTFPIV